jgi:hypothetical protein
MTIDILYFRLARETKDHLDKYLCSESHNEDIISFVQGFELNDIENEPVVVLLGSDPTESTPRTLRELLPEMLDVFATSPGRRAITQSFFDYAASSIGSIGCSGLRAEAEDAESFLTENDNWELDEDDDLRWKHEDVIILFGKPF